MKYSIISDINNNIKEELLIEVSSNNTLDTLLKTQGFIFQEHQISAEIELYHNFVEFKTLPYYNLLQFPSSVSSKEIDVYVPICVLSIAYNTQNRIKIFVAEILKKRFFQKYHEYVGNPSIKFFLLQAETFKEVEQKLFKILDIICQNFKFYCEKDIDQNEITKIKLSITLLIKELTEKLSKKTNYSIPFIENIPDDIKETMINKNQNWAANVNCITVEYEDDEISGTFELLYSLQKIEIGHRLFHYIDKKEQVRLYESIVEKWPICIYIINSKTFLIPKQLWYLPIIFNSQHQNLWNFVGEKISFSICDDLIKYYDKSNLNINRYQIVLCEETKKNNFNIL